MNQEEKIIKLQGFKEELLKEAGMGTMVSSLARRAGTLGKAFYKGIARKGKPSSVVVDNAASKAYRAGEWVNKNKKGIGVGAAGTLGITQL